MITPLLFLVLFGTIEFGRMIVSRQMLAYSTIEGARTASILGTAALSDVYAQVTAAAPLLTLTTIKVKVGAGGTWDDAAAFAARTAGQTMFVESVYTFTPIIDIGGLGTKTWTETQQAVVQ